MLDGMRAELDGVRAEMRALRELVAEVLRDRGRAPQ